MRVRDHLLAALIGVHVVLVTGTAIPESDTRESNPSLYEGLPAASVVDAAARSWNQTRERLHAVAFQYGRAAGTHQWWSMFSSLGSTSKRVEIAVRIDGEWQDVYVHGTDAGWRRGWFDHSRWREMYMNLQNRRYRLVETRFVQWVGDALFVRHPRADQVRVRTTLSRLPPPHRRHEGRTFDEVLWTRKLQRPR